MTAKPCPRLLMFYFYLEERPGHEPKLYQYGSSTIHDIVQRQLRVRRSFLRYPFLADPTPL